MNQLLDTITGWLGYLQRGPVQVQLLAVLLLLLADHLLQRLPASSPLRRWHRITCVAAAGLLALLLAALGQPYGLLLFLVVLIAGWYGLGRLRRVLARVIQPRPLALLDSRLIRPGYLLLATLAVIRQFDNPQDLALIPLGQWFGSQVTVGRLFFSVTIVYLLAMGTGPPAGGLAWIVQRGIGLSDGSRRAMALMIRYLFVGCGLIWALDQIGFNRTAILTVAGGLSVGLGFGIKEVFSNFVSGLWLLFEGSVRPGEILFIDGDPCEVRSLGLRSAVLWRDRDNAELVIPNQTFFTATTTTYTGTDRLRRSEVRIGAAYRHDPSEVIALLESIAGAHGRVLKEPPPRGLLLHYGDSSIDYALRFWIANPMDNVGICSEVQVAIWRTFLDHGIEIPYPQRVLHSAEASPDNPAVPPAGGS